MDREQLIPGLLEKIEFKKKELKHWQANKLLLADKNTAIADSSKVRFEVSICFNRNQIHFTNYRTAPIILAPLFFLILAQITRIRSPVYPDSKKQIVYNN
ncbi:hypothetical protein [Fluoribacter dumoffii]|uniref:hypothetical protein n=1 Tax=Fluoribacter dumoffii TaxID=463 RepID=UPI0022436869|nr:hypothetical protein [Fluoribacter dumoffii]MCW8460616.1 hypothetical protein [Fluoribacter dumoffii]